MISNASSLSTDNFITTADSISLFKAMFIMIDSTSVFTERGTPLLSKNNCKKPEIGSRISL